jgi:hypothetical protein
VAVAGLLAVQSADQAAAAAAAPGRLSVVYGVAGQRQVEASARVIKAPRGARALLESRLKRTSRVRNRGQIRNSSARLRWRYPAGSRAITIRVRVVSKARKTIATGRWRTITVAGLPRPRTVAPVVAAGVRTAPAPGQAGDVVLSGNRTIQPGQVLALGVGPATPDGLLARITAVRRVGGQTVATTVPATLPEVLPVGALDLQLNALPPAFTRMGLRAAPGQPFTRPVKCTNEATLAASGSASLTADVGLHVGWRFPNRVSARFEGVVEARSELSAAVSGAASCKLEPTPLLAQPIRLGAYTFTIGPVPVVLVPNVQFYVSASGSVEAALSTRLVSSLKANAGVQYENNRFSQFGGLTPSSSFTPPTLTASGTAQAAIAPTLDVLINGIGGPRVDLTAGLKLAADIAGTPWWKLTAPLNMGAQLRLDIWRAHLASSRLTVFSAEPQIAAAQTPAPLPAPPPAPEPPPPPAPAPPPPRERAQLTWDNQSDVDLHIWDEAGNHARYDGLGGIPDAHLLEDVIPGFGPERFVEDTAFGRRYTYGLCLYSGGDVNTTLTITDPGGATRQHSRYLPTAKSAAIVTTSPTGGGFIPDAGWCGADDPTTLDP